MQYSKPEVLSVQRKKPVVLRDEFSNVEQVGYVDISTQVKNLILSGERLMAYKRMAYEFPDGEFDPDTVKSDPTLDVGFDPADASFYLNRIRRHLKLNQKEKEVAEKEPSVSADEKVPTDAT